MKYSHLILLTLLSLLILLFSLRFGSTAFSWPTLANALLHPDNGTSARIIWDIRLPQALTAFCVGGLLALAGALQQVLLRNPLADPYILGTAGGAAVGALLAMLGGFAGYGLMGAAFTGALLSTLLVFGLARGIAGSERLLLTGIVLAAGWGALIALILTLSPDRTLRGMLFWLLGDLVNTRDTGWGFAVLFIALGLCWLLAKPLDLLTRGETLAASLGVDVLRTRGLLFVIAALLTATAVTLAGPIGFIGLVVPHLLRLTGIRLHRSLLPGVVLVGGSLVMAADSLARSLWAPQQIPVGVLTAFIGVPVFLLLMRQQINESTR